jgi:hypothetical protein
MKKKIAYTILFFLKPAVFPLLALVFLFNSDTYISLYPLGFQIRLYIIIFVLTFILPSTFIPLFFGLGIFKTLNINTKNDNIIFLSILTAANILTLFILKKLPVYLDSFIFIIFIASAILLFLTTILTIFRKICYHSLALGSIAGFIAAISIYFDKDYFLILALIFFISGLVGFAKLVLEKNTQIQIYMGFIAGFFTNLGIFLLI